MYKIIRNQKPGLQKPKIWHQIFYSYFVIHKDIINTMIVKCIIDKHVSVNWYWHRQANKVRLSSSMFNVEIVRDGDVVHRECKI